MRQAVMMALADQPLLQAIATLSARYPLLDVELISDAYRRVLLETLS